MAYNYGFPATYQPVYQIPQTQQTQSNGIIWVQGEAGAKSYLVAPNTTVQLWDSESQTIFLKSADASGMPSMKVLDYTIRDSNKNSVNTAVVASNDILSSYATKDEIKAVTDQISSLRKRLDKLTKEDADE
jgi:hypothetical protein